MQMGKFQLVHLELKIILESSLNLNYTSNYVKREVRARILGHNTISIVLYFNYITYLVRECGA